MQTRKRIAVAGATGRVGHHVVDVLRERGHHVVPISRATGVDVITKDGLAGALQGVDAVVDTATGPSAEEEPATAFFTTAARNLQEEGRRAGVQRIVGVSIIGTDRFTGGYGAAKLAHERALQAGPVPARILRAAQFHEFVAQLMEWGRQGNVVYVPEMRMQPVAARAVGEALADLATTDAPALDPIPEIASPREEQLVELARQLAARHNEPVQIQGVHDPNDAELYESGGLLPGPHGTLAGPTFAEWLVQTYPVRT
ncbi:MAG TPA: NAD(P)H-binding protein [Candidatus Binatia bacterium]|nr:NAD(P)H-binding protein [Candidatus Binatia bacterium]